MSQLKLYTLKDLYTGREETGTMKELVKYHVDLTFADIHLGSEQNVIIKDRYEITRYRKRERAKKPKVNKLDEFLLNNKGYSYAELQMREFAR